LAKLRFDAGTTTIGSAVLTILSVTETDKRRDRRTDGWDGLSDDDYKAVLA